MPGKRPKSEYWYQYLMASKRTPRLSHQVPLRIRVQSLESSGDILSGSSWPKTNIQNPNSDLILLVSICGPIWFTWYLWVHPPPKTKNAYYINIYNNILLAKKKTVSTNCSIIETWNVLNKCPSIWNGVYGCQGSACLGRVFLRIGTKFFDFCPEERRITPW